MINSDNRKERLLPSSRRITLEELPPLKRDTVFVGATLTIVGGVLIQGALATDNDTLGIIGTIAAALGFFLSGVLGQLLPRGKRPAPRTRPQLAASLSGIALVFIALLVGLMAPSLIGVGCIIIGIGAPLVTLSEYIETHSRRPSNSRRASDTRNEMSA